MPQRYVLLHYDYVPDMVERRGPHREAHLALIGAWKEDGRIVLAGAVGDPPHGALIVVRDAADAQAFVDADPYARNGLVTDWRAEPWTVV
ncbi:MAG TPA: YciI family protein [Solirubrobacteraceae bacterium]